MKLSKIKLYNYRCFGDKEEIIEIDDLTAFIGNNSTGKTAALCALKCLFSPNTSNRILKRSDFHLPKDATVDAIETQDMYIETVFTFGELDAMGNIVTDAIPIFFESFVVEEEGGIPYIRIRLIANWQRSNTLEGAIDSKIVYVVCPETQEVSEEDYKNASRKDLDQIRVLYVPAIRQPEKQLKNVSGTMINQVMNCINWNEDNKQGIKSKIDELNTLFMSEEGVSIFGNAIEKQWADYDSDERYSKARLCFNSTDIESSMKTAKIMFSPTVTDKEYPVEEIGDGMKSLFYISLVDSVLEVENIIRLENSNANVKNNLSFSMIPPLLSIILIEEPENHIAPHLLGKLIEKLKYIAEKSNGQMIVSSHSPSIIKRIDPRNIRHFRMDYETLSTKIHSISLPDKENQEKQYKYIKEAVQAYPELYFSKLVIFGEGDSEELLLTKFLNCNSINLDTSGISVVPLGGRHVNHFWRLLEDLKIPYITLLDLDRERYGGGWGRIKYVLTQLIDFGYPKEDLLRLKSGMILPDDDLNKLEEVMQGKSMNNIIERLEKYNVFFSKPLDIDFLMLENYEEYYKKMLEENEGPRLLYTQDGKSCYKRIIEIESDDAMKEFYNARVDEDVRKTLKKEGGDGVTYTRHQKELMVWYAYFFLGRGKPTTHILALSFMDDKTIISSTPEVIDRMIFRIKDLLDRKKEGIIHENSN